MTLHLVGGFWLLAVALLQYHILQAARQSNHAFLLGILLQVSLAFCLCCLALLGTYGVDALLLLAEIVLHDFLCVLVWHLQFVTADNVLDCHCEIVDVKV